MTAEQGMVARVARAIREEILRQHRDDDRGRCPAGSAFYEDHVSPTLVARVVLEVMQEPTDEQLIAMQRAMFEATGSAPPSNHLRVGYTAALSQEAADANL